jgi:hypothetical protein
MEILPLAGEAAEGRRGESRQSGLFSLRRLRRHLLREEEDF